MVGFAWILLSMFDLFVFNVFDDLISLLFASFICYSMYVWRVSLFIVLGFSMCSLVCVCFQYLIVRLVDSCGLKCSCLFLFVSMCV